MTDLSATCLIHVLQRGRTNVPESTTRELISLRNPSCSTGFETVIVFANVALPVASEGVSLVIGIHR